MLNFVNDDDDPGILDTLVVSSTHATVVRVSLNTGKKTYVRHGTSRRDPSDTFDPQLGYDLAMGRALRAIGRAVLKDANAEVRKRERRKQSHLAASRVATEQRDARKATRGAKTAEVTDKFDALLTVERSAPVTDSLSSAGVLTQKTPK